ncbi:hypothetical protein VTO42DRAFT_5972 [Malbranchea cinnamomea]
MPGLVRKILIFAAIDGLILQPYYGNGSSRNSVGAGLPAPVQIEYKTRRIYSLSPGSSIQQQKGSQCLESHGIVGLLSVASYSFLISITQRQLVAQILGKPIFVVTGVAVIPLSSQSDASKAIEQAKWAIKNDSKSDASVDVDSSSDSELEDLNAAALPDPESYLPVEELSGDGSSVAEDVIGRRGLYGRFAKRWFSRQGWVKEKRMSHGMSRSDLDDPGFYMARSSYDSQRSDIMELDDFSLSRKKSSASERFERNATSPSPGPSAPAEENERTYELMPKFLRYTKMMLSSRSFYFSYDYDITRRFGTRDDQVPSVPLFRRADPLYFWNRHMMKPFIEGGHHGLVLPLMQGFIGQHVFTAEPISQPDAVPEETGQGQEARANTEEAGIFRNSPGSQCQNFLLTLISRRSVKRAGVRYLRRGVDDEGNTANSVETEQILSTPSWDPDSKVYSLLQLRGSIPLYFTQSPYYFKPLPIIRHSAQTNQLSFDRHFHDIGRRYGNIQAVCLLDKHGVEVKLGEAYEKFLDNFNKSGGINGVKVGFEWFDFHSECRGMKFENVSRLVTSMADTLESFGSTVVQGNKVLQQQSGIIRTNCMDCLDRTGVTQCAFGQWALEHQLKQEGYTIDLRTSTATQWFNILWADNGDAISKQYSSTAALKGDYTRTRKRDYRGALNDLGLTLSRYYNNIVTDYFLQACIDYLLGDVTTRVFDEFETELESADPGISIEKARQNAIDTSCQIVISDEKEELIGGWIMLSPRQPNTLRTLPFEQSVLLLTDAAVYCCRFDWNTEKVTSFERIDLHSIKSITYGTYITSTLTEAQMDEKKNVGLLIAYQPGQENIMRINTRSLQSLLDPKPPSDKEGSSDWDFSSLFKGSKEPPTRYMAFKLPPQGTSAAASNLNEVAIAERDRVRAICVDIERTAMGGSGVGHIEGHSLLEEADIISLADARKRTSILEHLVFDIKKLVWA